jgi:hypothetical protein
VIRHAQSVSRQQHPHGVIDVIRQGNQDVVGGGEQLRVRPDAHTIVVTESVDPLPAPVALSTAPHGVDADAIADAPSAGARRIDYLTGRLVPAVWGRVDRLWVSIAVHLAPAEPRSAHAHDHAPLRWGRLWRVAQFHPFSAQRSHHSHRCTLPVRREVLIVA